MKHTLESKHLILGDALMADAYEIDQQDLLIEALPNIEHKPASVNAGVVSVAVIMIVVGQVVMMMNVITRVLREVEDLRWQLTVRRGQDAKLRRVELASPFLRPFDLGLAGLITSIKNEYVGGLAKQVVVGHPLKGLFIEVSGAEHHDGGLQVDA